jgi:4-hydroxybenzoate polyprenyltransferase
MVAAKVSAADVLMGIAAPRERTFRNKIFGFMSLIRLGLCILLLPLPLVIAALAGVPVNDPVLVPLCIVAFLAVAVVMGTNDVIDAERDERKWPRKPLPAGLLSKSEAVLFMVTLGAVTLALAGIAVSWLFAIALLITLLLNYIYSAYARDHVGYVTVIFPLIAMLVLMWVAVSPGTLSTPLALVLFILVAAAGLAGQITHEALDPTIPALFVRPRPTTEQAIYVVLVIIWFLLALWICLYAHLSWLFLVPASLFTTRLLYNAKFLGENRSREKLESAYKVVIALYLACFFWLFAAFFV